jgi:G:T-mismatch repair DNA endonuclease (very short patch repair protein)
MSRIKSKWTKPEVQFLIDHASDASLVIHPDYLPFKPDFILGGEPVFIDGEFWHCQGKINWTKLSEFWQDKLLKNLARDLSREVFWGQASLIRGQRQKSVVEGE